MTIRNDATRQRIPTAEARPLRGVVARQGQALLDTDVNEAERTVLDRVETADSAMLGPADRLLYPAGTTGFAVSGTAANCTVAAGTGYLGGWQLANPAAVTLATQPNKWAGAPPALPAAVVLKALVRHIDPVEDPGLADVALGDAQASGRALNDWQAFLYPVPPGTTCASVTATADWQALVAASTGTLAFQLAAPTPSSDPCSLTPAGGHSRFENLLYRIEVHGGVAQAGSPTADGPRFKRQGLKLKLSRRNASLMVRITQINGAKLTVAPPALDPRAWFEQGAYAEIVGPGDDIDPAAALAGERMFKIAEATDDTITLNAVPNVGAQANGKWFLRLWDAWPDGAGTCTVPASGGPIDLGDGIAIKLAGAANATFRRGDYWTAAVRADGSVAWPGAATPNPAQQPPHGPETRYAPLAILGGGNPEDCRIPFATLSDRSLLYRGGDGQQAFAPEAGAPTPVLLAQKLRVAVMRGATPVAGARVRWRMPVNGTKSWIEGSDLSAAAFEAITGADGLVEVKWAIDAQQQGAAHAVEAVLLDNGSPATTPPVRFAAQFATAAKTSYKPGKCPTLAKTTDVQAALDALCEALDEREPDSIRLKKIALLGEHGIATPLVQKDLILNGLEVDARALAGGVAFELDPFTYKLGIQPDDPLVEVSLDLPYPTTDSDRVYWRSLVAPPAPGAVVEPMGRFGFMTMRLEGRILPDEKDNVIVWRPMHNAERLLLTAARHRFGASPIDVGGWEDPPLDRVLCRIRLRSALVFADNPRSRKRIWLNAEHLGTRDKITGRELLLETRDAQRSADLDMFVYLRVPEPGIVFYYPKASDNPHRSNLGTVEDAVAATLDHWNRHATTVQLTAHADDPGTGPFNLGLSQKRAEKVKALLVSKGIADTAIIVQALGNNAPPFPKAPNADESLNRRVAVTFPGNFKP